MTISRDELIPVLHEALLALRYAFAKARKASGDEPVYQAAIRKVQPVLSALLDEATLDPGRQIAPAEVATELLAAAKNALRYVYPACQDGRFEARQLADQLNAAIAKAEGRS